jgi:2-keto-4-pentenoate hydratase/2-oxohepta-3-ene-1,7-dioic acid hydratase in catechol pathway
MRFINVDRRAGLVVPGGYLDIEESSRGRFPADPHAVLLQWSEFRAAAPQLRGPVHELDRYRLGAPSPRPGQVFGIGLNYRDHVAEANVTLPASPATFTKFPTSITGPYGTIELSGQTVDWEVELVVVIGSVADDVPASKAWDHVAGLTAGQDFTDRTMQSQPPIPQFSLSKSFAGYGPTGPELVTIDELDDPDDLPLSCSVNGEVMQDGRTRDLIFSVAQLIEHLSGIVQLQPGDLIFTGTPRGVGMARTPPRYLRDGDIVESAVSGIGTLRHRFVAPADAATRSAAV